MRRCTAALIALLPALCFADGLLVEWRNADQNVDGTPFTDLAGTEIELRAGFADDPDHVFFVPGSGEQFLAPFCGNWYVQARHLDNSGDYSKYSPRVYLSEPCVAPGLDGDFTAFHTITPVTNIDTLPLTTFNGNIVERSYSVPGQSIEIGITVTPGANAQVWERLISKASGTSEQDHDFMISLTTSGQYRYRQKAGGVTLTIVGGTVLIGIQQTIKATYNGAFMSLEVDGSVVASVPHSGDMPVNGNLVYWGGQPNDSCCRFQGEMSGYVR